MNINNQFDHITSLPVFIQELIAEAKQTPMMMYEDQPMPIPFSGISEWDIFQSETSRIKIIEWARVSAYRTGGGLTDYYSFNTDSDTISLRIRYKNGSYQYRLSIEPYAWEFVEGVWKLYTRRECDRM